MLRKPRRKPVESFNLTFTRCFIVHVKDMKRTGMAVYPFVFLRKDLKSGKAVVQTHEQIHLLQQAELLFLPFYILYLLNYLWNRWRFGDHESAYRAILFEREAYRHESDPLYLKKRKMYGWVRDVYRSIDRDRGRDRDRDRGRD